MDVLRWIREEATEMRNNYADDAATWIVGYLYGYSRVYLCLMSNKLWLIIKYNLKYNYVFCLAIFREERGISNDLLGRF